MDSRHIELLNSVTWTRKRYTVWERKRKRERKKRERERKIKILFIAQISVGLVTRLYSLTRCIQYTWRALRWTALSSLRVVHAHLCRRRTRPMTLLSKSVLPRASTFARFSRINVTCGSYATCETKGKRSARELFTLPLSDNNRRCTCIRRERKRGT